MMLVTGGAGFIGSHIVDALLNEGQEVLVIDDLSTGKKENLEQTLENGNIDFRREDLRSTNKSALQDVDLVFHEAAQIDLRRSVSEPILDMNINIGGTLNLLENMRKSGSGKIIYASSGGAVYGNPENLPCGEAHPANPVSPYGVSKLIAEKYISAYHELYGIDYVNLRYANVYGPRQDPAGEAGVISIFVGKALRKEPLLIFGDGSQTRDFIHVRDVVKANIMAIDNRFDNKTLNVGTGVETSVNELAEMIGKSIPESMKVKHVAKREGEVDRICLDISRIERLGFKPGCKLGEGIDTVIEWLRSDTA